MHEAQLCKFSRVFTTLSNDNHINKLILIMLSLLLLNAPPRKQNFEFINKGYYYDANVHCFT